MKFCVSCGQKLEDDNRFCPVCGTESKVENTAMQTEVPTDEQEGALVTDTKNTDDMRRQKILEYLFYAKMLEGRKFGYEQLAQMLRAQAQKLQQKVPYEPMSYDEVSEYRVFPNLFFTLMIPISVVISIPMLMTGASLFEDALVPSVFGGALIAVVLAPIINHFRKRKAIRQIDVANTKIMEHTLEKQENNRQKAKALLREAGEADRQAEEVQSLLNNLYALDVLYPKYRNLVAVATLYEYFEAKRCYSLDGFDGAYNRYETELRMNAIIGKLDDVIAQLHAINQTQQALCQLVEEGLFYAKQTYEASCRMAETMQDIRLETANAAHAAKVNKENTEFLTYYTMLTQ